MQQEAYVTLAALEHDWGHAWMTRDEGLCGELIGDDFVEIGANGRFISKAEWLAGLQHNPPRQVHWVDLRVRPLGRNAIVHGRVRLLGASQGHDQRDNYIVTDVWVWRAEGWRVVSRQLTPDHAHAHTTEHARRAA